MRIGIDISQIVHGETGVGNYVKNLVRILVASDKVNTYILFGSSLRKREIFTSFYRSLSADPARVILKTWFIPPTILDILWNSLHIIPVEWIIGRVDVFWSSDWTQPPLKSARGVTTIHDVSILRYPRSFHKTILAVQKRRLKRVKQECDIVLCDSEATKKDVVDFLHIDQSRTRVVYPGFTGSHT
jgi:hypothetical protein